GAFGDDFAAKPEKLCRPAHRAARVGSGLLDQALRLDEAAEVLLVQARTRDRFDRVLKIGQREGFRHQFEDHRPVFELSAHAPRGRRENAAMVVDPRASQLDACRAAGSPSASIANRLVDEPRFVEKLIAFEDALLVPARSLVETKTLARAFEAPRPGGG